MDSLEFENPELNNNSNSQQDQEVEQQNAIDFSNMLMGLFEDASEDFKDISIEDLKTVYRQSELSYGKNDNYDLNIWGLARVNMYIRQKTEGTIAEFISELTPVELKEIEGLEFEESLSSQKNKKLEYVDATQDWTPSKEDFALAEQYTLKYDLNFTFSSLDELYIDEYKPIGFELE